MAGMGGMGGMGMGMGGMGGMGMGMGVGMGMGNAGGGMPMGGMQPNVNASLAISNMTSFVGAPAGRGVVGPSAYTSGSQKNAFGDLDSAMRMQAMGKR